MNQKSFRSGAIGALMDEYERAASDLIKFLIPYLKIDLLKFTTMRQRTKTAGQKKP